MSHKDRRNSSTDRQKASARLIAELILEELTEDSEKVGALLCEGDENSIDKAVYSAIFPNLVIFPLGSCCEIKDRLTKYGLKKSKENFGCRVLLYVCDY